MTLPSFVRTLWLVLSADHWNAGTVWWTVCSLVHPGGLVLCAEIKRKRKHQVSFSIRQVWWQNFFPNMFHFNDMMFWEIWSIWIYYIVSVRRQDDPNTALWLANQAIDKSLSFLLVPVRKWCSLFQEEVLHFIFVSKDLNGDSIYKPHGKRDFKYMQPWSWPRTWPKVIHIKRTSVAR